MTARHLRVGIVAPGWTLPGGPDALPALADLVRALAPGHRIRILALRYPHEPGRWHQDGVGVVAQGGGTRGGVRGRAGLAARALRTLIGLHQEQPFDVFHGLWADEPGAVAVAAARCLRRPSLVSVLGGELVADRDIGYGAALGAGGRLAVDASLRFATRVTVGSSLLLDQVAARRPAGAALVPLGVDDAAFHPGRDGRPAADSVLWVGSFEPVKDPVTALRTFARVAADRPGATLTMVGDGSLRAGLERLAGRLGVDDRVRFAGHVPRAELPDRYRAASVLLVSSRHEAQSMVAVEAAACGLPVVGTRVGALIDLGPGASTVGSGDPAALATVLATVLSDADRRASMGAEGHRVAAAGFALDGQASAFGRIYAELTAGRRP